MPVGFLCQVDIPLAEGLAHRGLASEFGLQVGLCGQHVLHLGEFAGVHGFFLLGHVAGERVAGQLGEVGRFVVGAQVMQGGALRALD